MFYRVSAQMKPLSVCRTISRGMCSKRGSANVPVRYRWSGMGPFERLMRDPFWKHSGSYLDRHMWNMYDRMGKGWGPWGREYRQPWWARFEDAVSDAGIEAEATQVKYSNKGFEVTVDVKNFSAEELSVQVSEGRLVVSGKHEKRTDDHGTVSREFQREFHIPQDVDVESFTSSLSEEGMLTVRADVLRDTKQIHINIEKPNTEKNDVSNT